MRAGEDIESRSSRRWRLASVACPHGACGIGAVKGCWYIVISTIHTSMHAYIKCIVTHIPISTHTSTILIHTIRNAAKGGTRKAVTWNSIISQPSDCQATRRLTLSASCRYSALRSIGRRQAGRQIGMCQGPPAVVVVQYILTER